MVIADSDSPIHSPARSSLVVRPLKRGRACMNCRFLKIKCDGVKPVCGPCRKQPKDDECEYDGPGRSRTKALEDTVHRLEARLHELENPDASSPSVTLFDPYTSCMPPPPPGRLSIPSHFQHQHRSMPSSPFGTMLLTPSSQHSPELLLVPLSPPSTTASTPPLYIHGSSPAPPGIFLDSGPDLHDPQLCDALIHTFLPHARSFGLFIALPVDISLQSTSPALFYTLCAFGAHLSSSQTNNATGDRFIYNALQSLATTSPAEHLLQAIQTEVLLAYYFWRTGVLLRARVHAASAGALVRGSGLHVAPSARSGWVVELMDNGSGDARPSPNVDEQQRERAVAAVFGLQSMLGVALDPVGELGPLSVPVPAPASSDGLRLLVRAQSALYRAVSLIGHAHAQQRQVDVAAAFQAISREVEEVRGLLPPRSASAAARSRSYSPQSSAGSGSGSSGPGSAYSSPRYANSALSYPAGQGTPDYNMAELPPSSPSPLPFSMQSRPPYTHPHPHPRSPLSFPTSGFPPDEDDSNATLGLETETEMETALAHALLDGTILRLHDLCAYAGIYTYEPNAVRAAQNLLRAAVTNSKTKSVEAPILGTLYAWAVRVVGRYAYAYEGEEGTEVVREAIALSARSPMMRWELGKGEGNREGVSGVGVGFEFGG
ncbi:Zn(2)-C6 fungal-type domain-containing protein [Mycena kentingensis (nom. inval.)]|nr:Zn(2)-C6 fungal-type domain-containing protein [Mycena kentingensis (nom. inval.)]